MDASRLIAGLNDAFGIAKAVRFNAGRGGLPRAVITTDAANGELYLHGGHVTDYRPAGHEAVLFVSKASWFEDGKPIRGGVPICFPWFADKAGQAPGGAAPSHGLVRTRAWDLVRAFRSNGGVTLELATAVEPFELTLGATFGPALAMALTVRNTAARNAKFEEALHSYFAVSNVRRIAISGLAGVPYFSKVEGRPMVQADDRLRFTGETDRIYGDTQSTCVIDDPGLGRRITVEKCNSNTTVVWNPWTAKAARMPDFGDGEWSGMVCIETCNVARHAVTLPAGATHRMSTTVSVSLR